jgi:hypothetical protein
MTTDVPTMSDKVLDHFDNQGALRSHVGYLNDIHTRAVEALKLAPERYKADQSSVEAQQLVLYRMAHQAAVLAKKLEVTFPKLKADLATVPQPKSVALPAPPKLESLAGFDARQRSFNMATTRLVGQGMNQGGPAGAAVAMVASLAIGVIGFQKQVRAMEDAHGQLQTFIKGSKGDLKVLGLAHSELVDVSTEVYRQSTELRALLVWAKEAEKQGCFRVGSSLDAQDQERARSITTYALIARLEAARAV